MAQEMAQGHWQTREYQWDPVKLEPHREEAGDESWDDEEDEGPGARRGPPGVRPLHHYASHKNVCKLPKGPLICQVEGCGKDLTIEKSYYQRYRVCESHLKMLSLMVDGKPSRFCQQCGRFHELQDFDGNKRSCRSRLAQHNARRRKREPPGRSTGGVVHRKTRPRSESSEGPSGGLPLKGGDIMPMDFGNMFKGGLHMQPINMQAVDFQSTLGFGFDPMTGMPVGQGRQGLMGLDGSGSMLLTGMPMQPMQGSGPMRMDGLHASLQPPQLIQQGHTLPPLNLSGTNISLNPNLSLLNTSTSMLSPGTGGMVSLDQAGSLGPGPAMGLAAGSSGLTGMGASLTLGPAEGWASGSGTAGTGLTQEPLLQTHGGMWRADLGNTGAHTTTTLSGAGLDLTNRGASSHTAGGMPSTSLLLGGARPYVAEQGQAPPSSSNTQWAAASNGVETTTMGAFNAAASHQQASTSPNLGMSQVLPSSMRNVTDVQGLSGFDLARMLVAGGANQAMYRSEDVMVRVSMKVANCTPDQLPADMYQKLRTLLASADANLVQGFLRPGCTHLVLDIAQRKTASTCGPAGSSSSSVPPPLRVDTQHPTVRTAAPVPASSAAASAAPSMTEPEQATEPLPGVSADALLSVLGAQLAGDAQRSIMIQKDDHITTYQGGKRLASVPAALCGAALVEQPSLAHVSPAAVVRGEGGCARLYAVGRGLDARGASLFLRTQGGYACVDACTRLPPSKASVEAPGEAAVAMCTPGTSVFRVCVSGIMRSGLGMLEAQAGCILSAWRPVLLVRRAHAVAAAELRALRDGLVTTSHGLLPHDATGGAVAQECGVREIELHLAQALASVESLVCDAGRVIDYHKVLHLYDVGGVFESVGGSSDSDGLRVQHHRAQAARLVPHVHDFCAAVGLMHVARWMHGMRQAHVHDAAAGIKRQVMAAAKMLSGPPAMAPAVVAMPSDGRSVSAHDSGAVSVVILKEIRACRVHKAAVRVPHVCEEAGAHVQWSGVRCKWRTAVQNVAFSAV